MVLTIDYVSLNVTSQNERQWELPSAVLFLMHNASVQRFSLKLITSFTFDLPWALEMTSIRTAGMGVR